jgi:outer membrane protein assembly factor BamB
MKTRPRRIIVLAFAFLLAACSAEVAAPRSTDAPLVTASPTASPEPTTAASDIVYLRSVGSGGVTNILVIDARTGATLRTLPDGSPSFDRSTLYATEEANGATQTVVRRIDIGSQRELGSFTLDGTYHAIWTDSGQTALSRDDRLLALSIYPYKVDGEWVTGYKVIDPASGTTQASLDLKGQSTYGFAAMSPDGRSLYLNGPLALSPSGETDSGIRVFDVPSSTLLPANAIAGAVKQSGFRTAPVFSKDGRWMFSLDAGNPMGNCTSFDGPKCTPKADERPYIVALDLVSRRMVTVPLPMEQRSTDFEKYVLWSVAVAPDGGTVYAINPALGLIDEVDARQMTIRRTSTIKISRGDAGLLSALRQILFPVAQAKRYITSGAVVSPDGSRIYAVAEKGISVIETATLASRSTYFVTDEEFDSLALTPDGERLYAVSNTKGTIVIVATRDATRLGQLKLRTFGQTIVRIDRAP